MTCKPNESLPEEEPHFFPLSQQDGSLSDVSVYMLIETKQAEAFAGMSNRTVRVKDLVPSREFELHKAQKTKQPEVSQAVRDLLVSAIEPTAEQPARSTDST